MGMQARQLLEDLRARRAADVERVVSAAWHAEVERWYETVDRYVLNPEEWFGPRRTCGHKIPPDVFPLSIGRFRAINDEHERQHARPAAPRHYSIRPTVGWRTDAEWQDGTRPPVLVGAL